jgi:antitoxin ParD1/3/4
MVEVCLKEPPAQVRRDNKACYLLLSGYREGMNVSLTDELESVIEEKVKSGLYNNASEVVRDALRRAFCQPQSLDLEEDSPELVALIREGVRSRHKPHRKGDVRKLLDRFRQRSQA